MSTFDLRDDVWVASQHCAVPVATALRQGIIAASHSRTASENQLSKQEKMYQYLTGARFKHRIRAIVEKYEEMKGDLDQERRAITRQWAKREQQLQQIADGLAGLSGDLQGIAGQNMMEIDGLSMAMLSGPDDAPAAKAASPTARGGGRREAAPTISRGGEQ